MFAKRRGPTPKIDDLAAFESFAKTHGHLTQQEMSQQCPTLVSRILMGQALRKINFT